MGSECFMNIVYLSTKRSNSAHIVIGFCPEFLLNIINWIKKKCKKYSPTLNDGYLFKKELWLLGSFLLVSNSWICEPTEVLLNITTKYLHFVCVLMLWNKRNTKVDYQQMMIKPSCMCVLGVSTSVSTFSLLERDYLDREKFGDILVPHVNL